MLNNIESALLKLLGMVLHGKDVSAVLPDLTDTEWEQLFALADRHEVLALLAPVLESEKIPQGQRPAAETKIARTIHNGIQLQVLNASLTALLEEEDIRAVTLKGCTIARWYPVPEYRKMTDIDLYVQDREKAKKAVQILCANGFRQSEEWHANHHVALISGQNQEVELHTSWADAFQEKSLNELVEKLQIESVRHEKCVDVQGFSIWAYDTPWQACYLLIHMLLHFVGSGFGLRNLCDWVVLWEHCEDDGERAEFWRWIGRSGAADFARAMTELCVRFLGLPREKSPIPEGEPMETEVVFAFLRDVLDAGEFGYSEAERMVGMDGSSVSAYVREFHHQMHLNFQTAGKCPMLWPVLWAATLARFLQNNRKLKRPSVGSIMKKAKSRGELVRRLMTPQK